MKKNYLDKGDNHRNRAIIVAAAIVIPVLILIYLILMNFVLSYNDHATYDIGSSADADKPYFTPVERVSNVIIDEDNESLNYRELISQLVYFDVPIGRGSDSVIVRTRAKYGGSKNILLGMKNKENYSYFNKPLYSPLLENLTYYDFNGKDIYKVRGDKLPDNENDIPNGSVVFVTYPFKAETNKETYEVHDLEVNTSLRGGHTFYVYIPGNFSLEVLKQDLNWYVGQDELKIVLYDLNDKVIANTSIADDGIQKVDKIIFAKLQNGSLEASGLTPGVYRLEFSDFDGMIRSMKLSTNKIVSSKFYLADWATYVRSGAKPSELYFKGHGLLKFATYHPDAFQQVHINDDVIAVNSFKEPIYYRVNGKYKIRSELNDIIVTFPGYGSFSEDSYFEPFVYSLVNVETKYELGFVDYVISDYILVERDGDWFVSTVSFSAEEGYVKDGKLNFVFNSPGNESFLGIDWIDAEVKHEGII